MQRNPKLNILSYAIIAYMVIAFGWWSVLLYTKNRDAYLAKVTYQARTAVSNGEIARLEDFNQTEQYRSLYKAYQRQEWMILGESLALIISLAFGLYIIHHAYRREVRAAKQQRNFLLSITHELKSPIAGIKLVLETFLRRQLPENKVQQLTRNALRETDRLTELVEDLLLSARLEQTYQLHPECVDVAGLVKELIAEKEIKHPGAQFHLHVKEVPLNINADRSGLTSIIVNLLENAVKYAQPDPVIEVTLSRANDRVWLRVADNGIGIPREEKSRIFDKFYRVGNEDTRRAKGTGLGLYIVREIAQAHRGKISVTDNSPQGTVFEVCLPTDIALGEPMPTRRVSASVKPENQVSV